MKRLLQVSALLTLVGLALMVWSLFEPTPIPVILAMSVGQGVGMLAFGIFGGVVIVDQMRKQRAKGAAAAATAVAAANSVAGAAAADARGAAGGHLADVHPDVVAAAAAVERAREAPP
jgi:hypothetical protein